MQDGASPAKRMKREASPPSDSANRHSCSDPHCGALTDTPLQTTLARLPPPASLFLRGADVRSLGPGTGTATATATASAGNKRPPPPHFPLLKLTSAANARRQIFEFFRAPVPALFGGCYASSLSELHGVNMEYAVRACLGVNVGGHLADVVAWATTDVSAEGGGGGGCGGGFVNVALPAAWEDFVEDRIARGLDPMPRFNAGDWEDSVDGDEDEEPAQRRAPSARRSVAKTAAAASGGGGGGGGVRRRTAASSSLEDEGEVVVVGSDKDFRWGDCVSEVAVLWDSPFELRELYNRKTYLIAGINSTTYASLPPSAVAVTKSISTFPSTGELGTVEVVRMPDDISELEELHRKRGNECLKDIDPSGFKFGMPDERVWSVEREFELSYDLERLIEIRTSPEYIPLSKYSATKKESSFLRIKRNIYVDRKPRILDVLPICNCVRPESGVGGCDDQCLNRCMLIECPAGLCPTGDACTNQAFQRHEQVSGLEVFWTSARGYGLRTTRPIPANSLVVEYRGEIINDESCLDRLETVYASNESFYFLNYAHGEVIDACRKGTEARFVNHSCQPNCRIDKWSVNGEFCVGLFSGADIPSGTELTYDYRFESFGPMQRCLCGSRGCRGFIGVNKKVEDKSKVEKKKARKDETSSAQPRRHTARDAARSTAETAAAATEADDDDVDEFVFYRPRQRTAAGRVTSAGRKTLSDAVRQRASIRASRVLLMRCLRVGVVGRDVGATRGRRSFEVVFRRLGVVGHQSGSGLFESEQSADEPPIAAFARRRDLSAAAALGSDAISLGESTFIEEDDNAGGDTEDEAVGVGVNGLSGGGRGGKQMLLVDTPPAPFSSDVVAAGSGKRSIRGRPTDEVLRPASGKVAAHDVGVVSPSGLVDGSVGDADVVAAAAEPVKKRRRSSRFGVERD